MKKKYDIFKTNRRIRMILQAYKYTKRDYKEFAHFKHYCKVTELI